MFYGSIFLIVSGFFSQSTNQLIESWESVRVVGVGGWWWGVEKASSLRSVSSTHVWLADSNTGLAGKTKGHKFQLQTSRRIPTDAGVSGPPPSRSQPMETRPG